jgi:hypothetical protein
VRLAKDFGALVERTVVPHIPLLHDAMRAVETRLQTESVRTPALEKAVATEHLTTELAARLPGAEQVQGRGGRLAILTPDWYLRVKATNEAYCSRNYPTASYRRFLENEELPGIPASLPRLDIGYWFDPGTRQFTALHLVRMIAPGTIGFLMHLPMTTATKTTASATVQVLELEIADAVVQPTEAEVARRARRERANR